MHGSLTPELLKQTLKIRTAQIKRFIVANRETTHEVSVVLAKVSSHDIASFA